MYLEERDEMALPSLLQPAALYGYLNIIFKLNYECGGVSVIIDN